MYAIIDNGGKQYRVEEGQIIKLDRMNAAPKEEIEFDKVLMIGSDDLKVGAPYVEGAKVVATVVEQGKDKKVIIYKKRRRKDSKLKKGFRRHYTRVRITQIKG